MRRELLKAVEASIGEEKLGEEDERERRSESDDELRIFFTRELGFTTGIEFSTQDEMTNDDGLLKATFKKLISIMKPPAKHEKHTTFELKKVYFPENVTRLERAVVKSLNAQHSAFYARLQQTPRYSQDALIKWQNVEVNHSVMEMLKN
ncbi:hypothetical protein CEK25_004982 [Fusarium fujikuroi]|nr:hypothetical protein CEK25_004982 [Fusarium fujikuroi]